MNASVDHVIVLMMENRSFDHLLGFLDHPDPGFESAAGALCPIDPAARRSALVPATADATAALGVDPGHSYEAVRRQIYGNTPALPRMRGFIQSYADSLGRPAPTGLLTRFWRWLTGAPAPIPARATDIMRCLPESRTPVLSQLAKEFAVLTRWFAAVPGETWPNRNFAHAATSDGTVDIEARFYGNRTIFEQLSEADRDWVVYHDGIAQVWAFWKLWTDRRDNFRGMGELLEDIAQDRLPAYSFVEPDHGYGLGPGNSQHPANNTTGDAGFTAGEALIGRIYNALAARPEVFEKTLFLITYDEHGGFFDHVPPRQHLSPLPPAENGFDFRVSGVRVPAVAVSPLIPKGTIDNTFYDHSAIPKTVRNRFAPHLPPLTVRDRDANDLLACLPLLSHPRTDYRPVPLPAQVLAAELPESLNDFEASLLRLGGAVKTRLEQPFHTKTTEEPAFRPDPELAQAAQARHLTPAAGDAIKAVLGHFHAPADS
ncbi:alkaline phosphatase family protein [Amycolatopsis magusensis]|uniref:Phospholipase C n=1 Tax=Amycolatopsis magusensis TaxID=882444 RepID=A0ABS4PUF2_9PSEU|nr:alkaline phosphatase family protein [Amycolatopsis magusensis]MBP2183045.1 phospholipase C [Amycolatopsis magusensis]